MCLPKSALHTKLLHITKSGAGICRRTGKTQEISLKTKFERGPYLRKHNPLSVQKAIIKGFDTVLVQNEWITTT